LCPVEIVNAKGNESNETVEHDQLLRNSTEVLQNQTNSFMSVKVQKERTPGPEDYVPELKSDHCGC